MGNVVGIDLGTTNSVAAFKFAEVEIATIVGTVGNERGLMRSVVGFDTAKQDFVVGKEAYDTLLKSNPENVIISVKRLMGKGFNDPTVQRNLKQFGYKVTQSTNGTENSLSVWLNGQEYEPEDISAKILKRIVEHAQSYQEQKNQKNKITSAVITIPAYFSDKQRHATQMAVSRAGINCLELLPEPTAAAISYGFKPNNLDNVKTILVYDFGGGTFDSSVITAAGDHFIELGKAGDLWLGGDDVDELIIQLVKQKVAEMEGLDSVDALVAKMPHYQRIRFIADLKIAAERAKIDLSTKSIAKVIPSTPLIDDLGMAISIEVEITRESLEAILLPMIERSIRICEEAISLSEYTPDLIDMVLLVGGSSQIPIVQQQVKAAFGEHKVVVHPEPMYAVAKGAAIVAAGLVEKVSTVSRDYYIELADQPRFKLISQGEILPVTTSYTFGTEADGQRLVCFRFFNGDAVQGIDEIIGMMWLELDKAYPKGPEIAVMMELDEAQNGLAITASLKNNPSIRVSNTFSRGKVDEKMHQEVIEIIREINESGFSQAKVEEMSQQISSTVRVINQVVDGKTGQIMPDEQREARQKIDHIKAETSEDYNYAKALIARCEFLLEMCGFLIPTGQKERMRSHSQTLQDALRRNDSSTLQAYSEQAQKELDNLPDIVQMVLLSQVAINNAKNTHPAEANMMQTHLSHMLSALERHDEVAADRHWSQLQPMVIRFIDQQLPQGIIATGLVSV
ncbi:MAG: Hsp70 family protein [Oculatellaceae cyanobacterium Prado106]|jgi:molecular chaperone DnaK|nr:Hsp70 family protein [Oculatellaceae cyanobacterium Prado106]